MPSRSTQVRPSWCVATTSLRQKHNHDDYRACVASSGPTLSFLRMRRSQAGSGCGPPLIGAQTRLISSRVNVKKTRSWIHVTQREVLKAEAPHPGGGKCASTCASAAAARFESASVSPRHPVVLPENPLAFDASSTIVFGVFALRDLPQVKFPIRTAIQYHFIVVPGVWRRLNVSWGLFPPL